MIKASFFLKNLLSFSPLDQTIKLLETRLSMCGVSGIVSFENVSASLYEALTVLQHRGQDAAGIATCHKNRFYLRKANGLVKDVFHTRHMKRLQGNMGIGHVRYPTAGTLKASESQPFYVNSPYGIMLAHNGNLTNADVLRNEIINNEYRHLNTQSDSEILLNILAHGLQVQNPSKLTPQALFNAVSGVNKRCLGGYAVVALLSGGGLLAFRDPHGIRPLVLGCRVTDKGTEYMVASESVALDCTGFQIMRDIAPGEAVYIDENRQLHVAICADQTELSPCLFEYVYMARPDSVIDNISVYTARVKMGRVLAQTVKNKLAGEYIDVVMPIPDSSRASALELSSCLNLPYREGLVKNRYIGRTFIMPGQETRSKSVRRKLNAIKAEFEGKNVLLVDDSIVRGTTCRKIIEMAKEAGAKKVFFCSAAPPVRYPNVYGIDMPAASELVAYNRTTEQVCEYIGADALIYQDLKLVTDALLSENSEIKRFDSAVFDGNYLVGNINHQYLDDLEKSRVDKNVLAVNEDTQEDVSM